MRTSEAKLVERKVREICPLLSGLGPEVIGAVLADLFAMLLAGHVGSDAEKCREEIIVAWMATVRDLIPVNEKMILERMSDGSA